MRNAKIAGMGKYLPERVVTNVDLEKLMDTSDAWIRERTGIRERRFAKPGVETPSYMGAEASRQALEMAGMKITDIDFIIFATLSPDFVFPGSGCIMQEHLEHYGIGALDVRNQCSGFIYSLSIADQFIKTGVYNNILVVGSEVHSTGLDLSTRGRDVAVLFGDGAGAVVLTGTEEEDRGILTSHLHADGRYAKELWAEDPGSAKAERLNVQMIEDGTIYPKMNGRYVFKNAVVRFVEVIHEALAATGFSKDDIDLVIPHQANDRITETVQVKLELPPEKVYSNIRKYGNTTAASIPIAMCDARDEGLIGDGSLLCLAAFGSGFTWASSLIRL